MIAVCAISSPIEEEESTSDDDAEEDDEEEGTEVGGIVSFSQR